MRFMLAGVTLAAVLLGTGAAQAEKRLFIIASSAGFGIDRCLTADANCRATAANTYCRSHQYAKALSFRAVDRDEITGAVPTADACHGGDCSEFLAIECAR
jgi:hypothetical protein